MSNETALIPAPPAGELAPRGTLAQAAAAADAAAAAATFASYRQRRAPETLRAQDGDLARWAAFLATIRVEGGNGSWAEIPSRWAGVSWGLVEAFLRWQEGEGYSRASIARALSTVRAYAKLAAQAGALSPEALRLIQTVETPAPRSREGRNADAARARTRREGAKKAAPVRLTAAQVRGLKRDHPDTPQGRRDALLMALLLDHGLRVGEVAALTVGSIDLETGTLTFYREKVDLTQMLALEADVRAAAERYLVADRAGATADAPLFLASRKNGELVAPSVKLGRSPDNARMRRQPFAARAIQTRVRLLGEAVGLQRLSPHDCRHCWTTRALQARSNLIDVQHAGGWASISMVARYANAAAVANEGVRLTRTERPDKG